MKKITKIIFFILASIISIFLSLFSFNRMVWIWASGLLYEKILGSMVGFSAFLGILSTYYFWKRNDFAYWTGIVHALLFGAYALSVNLTGEFVVNLLFYIPIFIYLWWKLKIGKQIEIKYLTTRSIISFAIASIIIYLIFWFFTPFINEFWAKIITKNADAKYGANFNFFLIAKILSNLINTICVIALTMMVLGYKQTWTIWLLKNIFAIIFFSGVGIFDISVMLINLIYAIFSIYIRIQITKEKKLQVAIIGPGAAGKTTILDELKEYFKSINMIVFDERKFLDGKFEEYMKNMKLNAFEMQELFFKERYKQIIQMQFTNFSIIDRHLIDDVIFPQAHIELKNFDDIQKQKWQKIEWKYLRKLESKPKLDVLFVLRVKYEDIQNRRKIRSSQEESRKHEIEPENDKFFRLVNKIYYDENSKWISLSKKFAKKVIIFDNEEKEKIKKEIIRVINELR